MRAAGVRGLLALGVAVACGGRSHDITPTPSDDAASSAGTPSRSGNTSVGGRTSQAGSFAMAGTLSINLGGSGTTLDGTGTGGCSCGVPDECAPGYYRELDPGGCCSSMPCVLDCRDVPCSDIYMDCGPGMHRGTFPGQCCPTCVPDNPGSCQEAQELYERFRAETFGKYGYLDCTSRGCAIAVESNRCSVTCGTLVSAIGRDAIEEELELFAEATCSICPPPTEPVCLPKPPASCNVGECTFDKPG